MSRSGYSDGLDQWDMIRWRGAVASAIRGKRGQPFLREMLEALDALPKKQLITFDLVHGDNVCALGSVGLKREIDMMGVDSEDPKQVAQLFGIAPALAAEIEWVNDEECWTPESQEERFHRVRAWVVGQIKEAS